MTQIRYLSLLISQLCNDTKIEYSNLSNGIGLFLILNFLIILLIILFTIMVIILIMDFL